MNSLVKIVLPFAITMIAPLESSAATPSTVCTQTTPVASGPSVLKPRSKVKPKPPHNKPVSGPSMPIVLPAGPTTLPAPLSQAEMDAAEAHGKAMQKMMMDRIEALQAANTATPLTAKPAQVLTKAG